VTAFPSPIILIIDDDKTSRLALSRLLEREGYRIAVAACGTDGLNLAVSLQPDMILTDVVMPDMDGYELCRQLRQNEDVSDIPIIMLTTLEDQESRVKGIEAGADDFLSKPFEPSLLKARVKTVTRLNRYRRIQTHRSRLVWVVENAAEGYILCNQEGLVVFSNTRSRQLLNLPADPTDFALYPHLRREFTLLPPEEWQRWPNLDEDSTLQLLRPETAQLPACWLEVKALSHQVGSDSETLLRVADVTSEMNTQQSVWTFESLISHKLRTPLTKISWGVTFLRKKAHKLTMEQIVDFAEQAQGGVLELQAELEEVLSYINAPTAVPAGQGLALDYLSVAIDQAAALLEMSKVRLEPWSVLPPTVFLSKPAFDLICFELLQNSKKFHPDNNPEVTITVSFENGFVHFTFTDNGTGLPPDQLQQATKPYYQSEKGFTGQVPGMGLGLSMVSAMVQKVGGQVRLRNRADRAGLVVELKVPVEAGK
jgi:DNA-binding response OmpR family regulator